jgi:hypothetical protein
LKVITTGRTDLDEFFRLSGVLDSDKLTHTPFLAFILAGDTVTVQIIDRAAELLKLADDIEVMCQWRGDWRSDFFRFTVGRLRQAIEARDSIYKGAQNVIKTIGKQGGFRGLELELTDANGITSKRFIASKSEGVRVEELLIKLGISVSIQRE